MSDLQFISVTGPKKSVDSATRKAVRQHVARQRGKDRSLEEREQPPALSEAGSKFSWRLEKNNQRPSELDRVIPPAGVVASPNTMLSAARGDPFDVFPITMHRGDQELIDFWMRDLAFQRYGPSLGETYVPMRDLFFAQAVEHESTAHGMLFLSASWKSSSHPATAAQNQVSSLHHRGIMFEMINDALSKSDFTRPGLIQAIGFQLVYEAVAGNYIECRRHLVGMRSVLLAIGGPATLNKQPRVQLIFAYLSLVTTPDYLPICPLGGLDTSNGTEVHQARKDFAEINDFIDELLNFLGRIQVLSEDGWCFQKTDTDGDVNPFRPNTLLYHMLDPKRQPWSADFDGYLGETHTARAACLLLLCHALLALNAPSQACDDYMTHQINIIKMERADIKPNLRAFSHLLLKDTRGVRLRDVDVAYSASRNAQVVKRLSRPLHDKVCRVLLGCLAEERGPDHSLSSDEVQAIRDEVLTFQIPKRT